jgi:hypothetical protein
MQNSNTQKQRVSICFVLSGLHPIKSKSGSHDVWANVKWRAKHFVEGNIFQANGSFWHLAHEGETHNMQRKEMERERALESI